MTFIIPPQETKRHSQLNKGDVSGTLHITKNITLDEEAYIKLSHPTVAVMTTDDDADFDTADAMFIGDGKLFVNSDEVFSGDVDHDALSNHSGDTNAPSPGAEDDVMYFNGKQVVSDGTTVKYFDGSSTWTTIAATTISGTAPTALALFDGQNGLMVGHANKVDLINTSWALVRTLVLPTEYKVSSMVANGSVAYIATRHDASGEARMFIWDGTGTSATESYGIDAFEMASIKAYQSSVVTITSDGRLLLFTGGGFTELARLPIYNTQFDWSNDLNDYSSVGNRSMIVDGNLIYITFSSEITSNWKSYLTNFIGGVWCYDPAVGFYHRYSPTFTTITAEAPDTTDVNTSTDIITVAAAPVTGTPMIYDPVSTPFLAPLKKNKAYYIIYVSATTIKLAETLEDAVAGTAIDLTGTGNNFQKFYIYNINDYGDSYTDDRSSIAVLSDTMRDDIFAGRIAFAANVFNKSGSTRTSLCTPSPLLPNRGYFITPKLYSPNIDEKYNRINLRYRLLKADDEIVVKYRITEKLNYPIVFDETTTASVGDFKGTWTDTDTFTTTQDLSDVVEGEEIEIVKGVGGGFTAHVASISEAGGTYTVNLDEEFIFAAASDIFYFVVDNWKKLGTITQSNDKTQFRVDETSDYVQFKIELRGIETTITELRIDHQRNE